MKPATRADVGPNAIEPRRHRAAEVDPEADGQSLYHLWSDPGKAPRLPGCDVAPHPRGNRIPRPPDS